MKTCTKCLKEKPIDAFRFRKERGNHETSCKTCRLSPTREKYHSDPKFREKNKRNAVMWCKNNPQRTKEINTKSRLKRKMAALNGYGSSCVCCGERRISMLDIDHVNNDGATHRKTIGRKSMYDVVIKSRFPGTFQILCCNCNQSKRRNGGICEHKPEKRVDRFDRFKYRFDIANHIGVA